MTLHPTKIKTTEISDDNRHVPLKHLNGQETITAKQTTTIHSYKTTERRDTETKETQIKHLRVQLHNKRDLNRNKRKSTSAINTII